MSSYMSIYLYQLTDIFDLFSSIDFFTARALPFSSKIVLS